MQISEQETARLKAIYKKWCTLQGEIKRAEQISQLAVVPAINELRYAGRILVAALAEACSNIDLVAESGDDELTGKPLSDRLAVAEQYLTNADNDISDALIYFFQKRVDEINERFGAAAVAARYSKYQDISDKLEKARELIIESRANLQKRNEHYLEVKSICSELIDLYFDLNKSEVYSAIELERHAKAQRQSKIIAWVLGALLVISLVFHVI